MQSGYENTEIFLEDSQLKLIYKEMFGSQKGELTDEFDLESERVNK